VTKADRASSLLTVRVAIRTLSLAQANTFKGKAMNYTKIGRRLVVIGSSARVNRATGVPQPTAPRPKAQRIVVIRDGQWVSRRHCR